MLIHHVRRICTALVGAAAVMVTMATAVGPVAASPVQTKVHVLDGHRVMLDVYPAAGPLRGAAILSHGFTRSRRTLAGHAQALADAGVLVLTPDLPLYLRLPLQRLSPCRVGRIAACRRHLRRPGGEGHARGLLR
jgi:hypothetical protein